MFSTQSSIVRGILPDILISIVIACLTWITSIILFNFIESLTPELMCMGWVIIDQCSIVFALLISGIILESFARTCSLYSYICAVMIINIAIIPLWNSISIQQRPDAWIYVAFATIANVIGIVIARLAKLNKYAIGNDSSFLKSTKIIIAILGLFGSIAIPMEVGSTYHLADVWLGIGCMFSILGYAMVITKLVCNKWV